MAKKEVGEGDKGQKNGGKKAILDHPIQTLTTEPSRVIYNGGSRSQVLF